MYKQCKVVMLATDIKSRKNDLVLTSYALGIHISNIEPSFHNKQHLYIISDEEIKEGDFVVSTFDKWKNEGLLKPVIGQNIKIEKESYLIEYNEDSSKITGEKQSLWEKGYSKKIIATTDKSLVIKYDGKTSISENWSGKLLPQISQQFIEQYITEYNKGNIISDVLVEYEYFVEEGELEILNDKYEIFYPKKGSMSFGNLSEIDKDNDIKKILQINPDNTINIKTVKDSFSRDEVVELIDKAIRPRLHYVNKSDADKYIDNFIRQNL